MSKHYLVERNLRVDMRWVRARRIGCVKEALNLSQLSKKEKVI